MQRNDHYLSKIISACLLGDACIRKDTSQGRENRNGHLRLKQTEVHRDHLEYIAERLGTLTSVKWDYYPPTVRILNGREVYGKAGYQIRTQNHPMYTDMKTRWYLDGVKRIDRHACTLIDDEFLAIFYQQDGYIASPRIDCITQSIMLCTDDFSYGDLDMLRRAIIEKTGFVFNITKRSINSKGDQTYRMMLYRKQTPEFIDRVSRFVQPSFYYKLQQREHPNRLNQDDDVFCSPQECGEASRNEMPTLLERVE